MSTVQPSFTGVMETHSFAGVLIDMDGTIIDSTDAIIKHWHKLVNPVKWGGAPLIEQIGQGAGR